MSDEHEAVREITLTRLIDAPAHVKHWFGPVGWPLSKCEMGEG